MHYFIYTLDLKKKHSFELHRSTYMQIFFNTCVNLFFLPYDFLNNIVFSLAQLIVRIQHRAYTENVC